VLPSVLNVEAYHYSGSGIERIILPVIAEYKFAFTLNGKRFLEAFCSGRDLEEIALGHLLTRGILNSGKHIQKIEILEEERIVKVFSCNGFHIKGIIHSKLDSILSGNNGAAGGLPSVQIKSKLPEIHGSTIISCAADFYNLSTTNPQTHSVHSAALYSFNGKRTAYYEEIQKHNAIEKLLGSAFIKGLESNNMMLLSTGRFTGDIVEKLTRTGIPVIITRKAPTNLAIEIARKHDIMLITGVGENGFFIHHGVEKIK